MRYDMDAMTEEHMITALQVVVELPEEHHESTEQVMQIIRGMFEEDDYDVESTVVRSDKLAVVVHVPVKSNPAHETAILRQDNIASALILQRLMMSL
jgi:hypothetical protein